MCHICKKSYFQNLEKSKFLNSVVLESCLRRCINVFNQCVHNFMHSCIILNIAVVVKLYRRKMSVHFCMINKQIVACKPFVFVCFFLSFMSIQHKLRKFTKKKKRFGVKRGVYRCFIARVQKSRCQLLFSHH